jgi:hypothetical protein
LSASVALGFLVAALGAASFFASAFGAVSFFALGAVSFFASVFGCRYNKNDKKDLLTRYTHRYK